MARKTSGEIVNATLLEVFIALTFVFLAYGVHEGNDNSISRRKSDSLVVVISEYKRRGDSLSELVEHMRQQLGTLDSALAVHGIVLLPDCITPRTPIADVIIEKSGALTVRILRAESGYEPHVALRIRTVSLGQTFASAVSFGDHAKCRFFVDTHRATDTEYRDIFGAMEQLHQYFRANYPSPTQ